MLHVRSENPRQSLAAHISHATRPGRQEIKRLKNHTNQKTHTDTAHHSERRVKQQHSCCVSHQICRLPKQTCATCRIAHHQSCMHEEPLRLRLPKRTNENAQTPKLRLAPTVHISPLYVQASMYATLQVCNHDRWV